MLGETEEYEPWVVPLIIMQWDQGLSHFLKRGRDSLSEAIIKTLSFV
jgi:hypothetical protein